MKPTVAASLAACCLVFLMASPPSAAYVIGDDAITAEIPFEFTIEDRPFPAGSYRIVRRVNPFPSLRLESADGTTGALLLAVGRMSRPPTLAPPRAILVFDKVGEEHVLSEVWLPGRDGFRVRSRKQEHERVVVDAKD